jgi:hypothetical protein
MPPEILSLLSALHQLEPRVYLEMKTFDLGGIGIDVTTGRRTFEFFSGPLSGIGVSETHDDTVPFTAHDRSFDKLADATAHLLALVREAARDLPSRAA